jgi:Tol biopolymer transport system component
LTLARTNKTNFEPTKPQSTGKDCHCRRLFKPKNVILVISLTSTTKAGHYIPPYESITDDKEDLVMKRIIFAVLKGLKGRLAYITLACVLLLSSVVLWVNVRAQAPQQAQIAFASERDGNPEIYVMDADGKNPRNLTNNPARDWYASWSPDGRMIAFISKRDGNYEVYVMDADGKNPRRLTNHPAEEWSPSWSPDGRMIGFTSKRDGNYEAYVMDADGKNPRNLTNHPASDWAGSWSPDGRMIAFRSNRDGNYEIYVMDADGKNERRLTSNPALDVGPEWFDPAFARPVSPAGKLGALWGGIKQE